MKWRDVKPGDRLLVKGEVWTVGDVGGGDFFQVSLGHPTLGPKTGSPPPDGEVQRAPEVKTETFPEGRTLLRGGTEPLDQRSQRIVQREKHKADVAALNGVSVEAVEAMHVRLVLGGTTIAHLKPKEDPQVPQVEVMDEATMLTHLHFFHDVYPEVGHLPEEDVLDQLQEVHAEHEATTPHDHSLPF